jgi:alkylation response protein AidB-like acyl-CoA dehydrogenase
LRSTIIRYCSRRDGADWIFNGSKIFIAYGWHCDLVIVVAKTDPENSAATDPSGRGAPVSRRLVAPADSA